MPKMNVTDRKTKEDMGLKRILESPLRRNPLVRAENLIVDDRLEEGILRIYTPFSDFKSISLAGEIHIKKLRGKRVYVKRMCYWGPYRELADIMIDQVKHYKDFYPQFDRLKYHEQIAYCLKSGFFPYNDDWEWEYIGEDEPFVL